MCTSRTPSPEGRSRSSSPVREGGIDRSFPMSVSFGAAQMASAAGPNSYSMDEAPGVPPLPQGALVRAAQWDREPRSVGESILVALETQGVGDRREHIRPMGGGKVLPSGWPSGLPNHERLPERRFSGRIEEAEPLASLRRGRTEVCGPNGGMLLRTGKQSLASVSAPRSDLRIASATHGPNQL